MSNASSDAFLSGQGIPVSLPEIENELARLWGSAAEREGGPEIDQPTVTRLVLANLVVADLEPGAAHVDALIETIAERYPSRVLVLRPGDDAARRVSAEVSAVCHLPSPDRPQVCSERIVLHAGRQAHDLLPGAIRPLLETDLPLVLWWVGDPRPTRSLFEDLAGESSRVILDLPDPATEPEVLRQALDLRWNRYSRDIAWFGITPWRELVAQFFDPAGSDEVLRRINAVEIDAVAPAHRGDRLPRESAWLAGWLAGQLGWVPDQVSRGEGNTLRATFDGPSGEVEVVLRWSLEPDAPLPHLSGVSLRANGEGPQASYRLERPCEGCVADVRIEADAPNHHPLPRQVRAPEWDADRRIAAALESDRDDPPYRNALPHALWLLQTADDGGSQG